MREVLLDFKDDSLFNFQLNRSLYVFYAQHVEDFTNMWIIQGKQYWLYFGITFHSFLEQRGLMSHYSFIGHDFANAASIYVLKVLTGKSAADVHTFIKDTVNVARFKQLFSNLIYGGGASVSSSFINLFGHPGESGSILKLCIAHKIYLLAAGALINTLKRWLVAKKIVGKKFEWKQPVEWIKKPENAEYGSFEVFLKKTFGREILLLFSITADKLWWWREASQPKPETPHLTKIGKSISSDCPYFVRGNQVYDITETIKQPTWFYGYTKWTFLILYPRKMVEERYPESHNHRISCLLYAPRAVEVDGKALFHPLSQLPMTLWEKAFSSSFFIVAEDVVSDLQSRVLKARC